MKRRILIALAVILFASTYAISEEKIMNVIQDPGFVNGAVVIHPAKPMRMSGKIRLSDEGSDQPQWLMTQWNSRNNLIRTQPQITEGGYSYQNAWKTVARDSDGTLTLRVNGGQEYERARTSLLEGWVHLYFEQRLAEHYPLRGAESARLSMSFSITDFADRTPEGQLNPDLHAVIAVFYLTVADENPASASYGQYINFCVMLYDNRTGVICEETHMDSGQNPIDATNMLVYTMDSSLYTSPVYADGAWHDVDIDLLPSIRHALEIAQTQNCMTDTRFEDLGVRSLFFGFEVPGMMDCEMKIRNPSLMVRKG